MEREDKESLLRDAQGHVAETIQKALELVPVTEKRIKGLYDDLSRTRNTNATAVAQNLIAFAQMKLAGLSAAQDSPYFARCNVVLDGGENKEWYFGKFSLPELGIYSWSAPAARIRFEKPGRYEVEIEEGKKAFGELVRNDQYLIAQGAITFMSTEASDMPRTLIHHENFALHKSKFALVEIVEKMEKAQDAVIRTDARGPLLISGPAGSGKTTLALHRIAYLLQIPEQASVFTPQSILVLVQDDNTKQYFETLLPSLGISHVAISTFASWALELLGLKEYSIAFRFGDNEQERDMYEYQKHAALQSFVHSKISKKSASALLEEYYASHLSAAARAVFKQQIKANMLDRFDLAILLQHRLYVDDGIIKTIQNLSETTAAGKMRMRKTTLPLQYSLIVVDEVQNYLPANIRILRSCLSEKTRAITYVGDLVQQTSLFTLKRWEDAGENLEPERMIILNKVYRSTKQIMEYIRSRGFNTSVPEGLREGKDVIEYEERDSDSSRKRIKQIIDEHPNVLIGIIGFSPEAIELFGDLRSEYVRIFTVHEAQGIEFDVAIVLTQKNGEYAEKLADLRAEKEKIVRDQYYVAFTRAMNELYVVEQGAGAAKILK